MKSRSSLFNWTKSIAKRSGTRIVPSIARVAPRWAFRVQQPLTATHFEPRSGAESTTGFCRATRVETPRKVCPTGSDGVSGSAQARLIAWLIAFGRLRPRL